MRHFILAYLVAACIGIYIWNVIPKKQLPTPPSDRDSSLWKRGRAMYVHRCTSCHNPNPDLKGSMGPKLRGVSEELLTDRLMNGKNGMPAQPNLKRFIPALREYLR
jgi:mono/diheme cytochrome c family protein